MPYPKPTDPEVIEKFTLMDDEFMTAFFDGNTVCAQMLVRAATNRDDITITEVKTQYQIANLRGGKGVRLDVRGITNDGQEVYIEVENTLAGTDPHRPRLYIGMRDSMYENPGTYGENLPQLYMIFICRHDPFGKDKGRYVARRMIMETGEVLNDGITIIYLFVGGKQDNALLGDIMHDFTCSNYSDMRVYEYAEATRQLKIPEKGGPKVSKIFENYINEHKDEWLQEGEVRGVEQGENKAMRLIQALIMLGRGDEVSRAASDADYRRQLYTELKMV